MTPSPLIDRARAVPIEDIIETHGIKLRGRIERIGPCPVCGGTDRFAINTRKQLFNCRGCGTGGDVISLVQFLDDCTFREAVETLAGSPREARGGYRSTSSPGALRPLLARLTPGAISHPPRGSHRGSSR